MKYLFFAGIFLASFILTSFMRRVLLSRSILAIPNSRSSHTLPVPAGGGLSFVATFLLAIIVYWLLGSLSTNIMLTFVGSGMLVATIGFFDDVRHISYYWRLLTHFLAVGWALYWVGSEFSGHYFSSAQAIELIYLVVASISMVWLLNLYNFMDGIDGIAGSQAVFISLAASLFFELSDRHHLAVVSLILACSVSGFLVWNWPPAKIFMGDVGSGFLGLILGILIYVSTLDGRIALWTWIIIFGVFVIDSTITLVRRILRGDKWYSAHRSHAYQQAARKWGHLRVTITVSLINVFWLFPLAMLTLFKPGFAPLYTFIALTPLVLLAIALNAGKREL